MLSDIEQRERRRTAALAKARRALFVDMLKSYAGPLLVAAFVTPLLAPSGRMGAANQVLLVAGLVMIGLALIFVEPKE